MRVVQTFIPSLSKTGGYGGILLLLAFAALIIFVAKGDEIKKFAKNTNIEIFQNL